MSEALIPTNENKLAVRRQLTKMKAADAFHGAGFDRLLSMLESPDERIVLAVMNFLGKISGDLKTGPVVAMQFSFDELFKKAATNGHSPLSTLTQITESSVIDADDEDD